MKATIEERGPWQKAVAVTVEADAVAARVDMLVSKYRERAQIPGFRKGKVPIEIVRTSYAGPIQRDALNELLPEALDEVIETHALRLAAPPTISDLSFKPGEPLTFTAVVDLWPEIEPRGYEGLEFEEEVNEVDDATVEEFLEEMRRRLTSGKPVLRPSVAGDLLEVVVLGVDPEGNRMPKARREEIRIEAGGEGLLPEFREASVGVSNGDVRMIHARYPADFPDQELAGTERHFQMKVRSVIEKQVPALDDAFAKAVDGVESLDALREKVRKRFEAEEQVRARERTEEALVDKLIEGNPFDLPEALLAAGIKRAIEHARKEGNETPEEELAQALTPHVIRRWKRDILVDAITRKEAQALTDEEFEEKLKAGLAGERSPAAARRKLEAEGKIPGIRDRLQEQKTLRFLLQAATIHRILKPRVKPPSPIITP